MNLPCPEIPELEGLADGALPAEREEAVRAHVAECAACAAALGELARIDAALIETLSAAVPNPAGSRAARLWAAIAAAAALALLAWLLPAADEPAADLPELADAPAEVPARVAVLEGDARVHPAGSGPAERLVENRPLRDGDRVVTEAGERARIELPERTELYVNEGTEIVLPSAAEPSMKLNRGEILARTLKPLRIETPEGIAEIAGAEARIVADPAEVRLAPLQGRAEFRRKNRRYDIDLGEELVIPRGGGRPQRVAHDRRPEWDRGLRSVEFVESFRAGQLAPVWRAQPKTETVWRIQDEGLLALSAPAEAPKRRVGSMFNLLPFRVDEPITFEFRLRQSSPHPAGRTALVLAGQREGDRKLYLRYVMGYREEFLETLGEGMARPERLWHEKRLDANRGWVTVRLTVGPEEVRLERNGVERIRRPHALGAVPALRIQLHTITADRTQAFETQFSMISVRRETAR